MGELETGELISLLKSINQARKISGTDSAAAERLIELRFRPSNRLAVYGTLMPGRENHHRLDGAPGQWSEGWVHGSLHPGGWGSILGYPVLRWNPLGQRISVWVLSSEQLMTHWEDLDEFEGPYYLRALIPVFTNAGLDGVANIYIARE